MIDRYGHVFRQLTLTAFTSSLSFRKFSTQTTINCGKIRSVKYLFSKPVLILSPCMSSLTYFSLSSFVSFSLVWWTLCRPPVDSRYLLITQYHSLPIPITNCSKFPPASVGLLLPGAFRLSFHPFSFLLLSQRTWNCLCKEMWAQPLCPSPRVGRRHSVSITQYLASTQPDHRPLDAQHICLPSARVQRLPLRPPESAPWVALGPPVKRAKDGKCLEG